MAHPGQAPKFACLEKEKVLGCARRTDASRPAAPHTEYMEGNMTFSESVSTCLLKKYADFEGRARRSEFWWFELFQLLVSIGLGISSGVLGISEVLANGLALLFSLAVLLPSIAVAARRLHDVNRSGWWQLIGLTIIGIIPLFYWLCIKGDENANHYGPPV